MPTAPLKRRKRGRKPAARDGEQRPAAGPSLTIQTTLRLEPFSKAGLEAVASLQSRGQAEVVEDALELLIASLPIGDRELVETLRKRYVRQRSQES